MDIRTKNGLNFRDEMEFRRINREFEMHAPFLTQEQCEKIEFAILSAVFDQLGPRKQPELDMSHVSEMIALSRFWEN